jgi:hypothetical protein
MLHGSDIYLNPLYYNLTGKRNLWFYPDEENPDWQRFRKEVEDAAK